VAETRQEQVSVSGKVVTVTLTQDVPGSRFPIWLKTRCLEWYTVLEDGRYLGEVFLINGEWKAFDTSVVQVDGTYKGALARVIQSL